MQISEAWQKFSALPRTISDEVEMFGVLGSTKRAFLWVYEYSGSQVSQIGPAVLQKASWSFVQCALLLRSIQIVDFCVVVSTRVVDKIGQQCLGQQYFDSESLKTRKQRKWKEEVKKLRSEFPEKSPYPDFCKSASDALKTYTYSGAGEGLRNMPRIIENGYFWALGWFPRYGAFVAYEKGIRETIKSLVIFERLQRMYYGFSTRTSYFLGDVAFDPTVNLKNIFLKGCQKLQRQETSERPQNITACGIQTLSKFLSQQPSIELYLSEKGLTTKEQRMIGMLTWLKEKDSLPKGAPQPDQSGMFPGNLDQKMDEALDLRAGEIIAKVLARVEPELVKNKNSMIQFLFHWIYGIHVRKRLIPVLSDVINRYGIKQITDPHLLILAILYANNIEVMDWELDGFGRNKEDLIMQTGQGMLKALREKKPAEEILSHFEKAKIEQGPGGLEGIAQVQEAERTLKEHLSGILLQMLEKANLSETDQKQDAKPFVGSASFSLPFLYDGLESFIHFLQNSSEQFVFGAKREMCEYLATRIIQLLKNPIWKIAVLKIIDEIEEELERNNPELRTIEKGHIEPIMQFVVQELFPEKFPLREKISSFITGQNSDQAHDAIVAQIQAPSRPFLEEVAEGSNALCKEFILYCRMTDGFRKRDVAFDADRRFWEYFIRECLNQLVEQKKSQLPLEDPIRKNPPELRNLVIDELLALDEESLFNKLAQVHQSALWES